MRQLARLDPGALDEGIEIRDGHEPPVPLPASRQPAGADHGVDGLVAEAEVGRRIRDGQIAPVHTGMVPQQLLGTALTVGRRPAPVWNPAAGGNGPCLVQHRAREKAMDTQHPVEVRNRFDGEWNEGFRVVEERPSGVRLERLSDGVVLPEEFPTRDVRQADAET